MLTYEVFKNLSLLREDKAFIFPRASICAVVQKAHRITYVLAKTLLSWGKVFVYSEVPTSIASFLALYKITGENLYLASPYFDKEALSSVLSTLHRETSPAVLILEAEEVPEDFFQEFYSLLLKGHTAVFCLGEAQKGSPLLDLCDEVYEHNFFEGYHILQEASGEKKLFFEQDWTLVEVGESHGDG